jgi:hypothetical protein
MIKTDKIKKRRAQRKKGMEKSRQYPGSSIILRPFLVLTGEEAMRGMSFYSSNNARK